MQGVKQRAKIGVNFVIERSRQESEALTSFDRWAGQDYATDLFALKRLHGLCHSQISLSGSGWSDAKDNSVLVYLIDVKFLADSLGPDALAARRKNALAQHISRSHASVIDYLHRASQILRS